MRISGRTRSLPFVGPLAEVIRADPSVLLLREGSQHGEEKRVALFLLFGREEGIDTRSGHVDSRHLDVREILRIQDDEAELPGKARNVAKPPGQRVRSGAEKEREEREERDAPEPRAHFAFSSRTATVPGRTISASSLASQFVSRMQP